MHTAPRNSRRIAKAFLLSLEIGIVSVIPTITVFRLGNMHLEGLPAAFGGGLALLAAVTSLLFNRARAYPAGKAQRRTLLAAELSLRAVMFATFGVVLSAFVFPFLASSGYQTAPWEKLPNQVAPAAAALIVALFFLRAAFFLLYMGRIIGPTLVAPLSARHVAKATRSSGN